ncbi:hypothetical protein GHK92_18585 [Nocardioides sp. dk4132]|uniref:hypothetical protein n=1 Tax=unclassified Nocardioides TaxID=2615069 RepID=UPI001297BB79|nr:MULTISPECIES: hypothetical protein [unclassified Nocardioides]MQW77883.1 hypothetical protein [Nocardioides sp. dk4132]QGA08269.1 hypothetical protein GFH29_13290 [Nocardioides sp. dk884]
MSTPLLWTRAVVLAVAALGAGVVSHVAADGSLPGPLALLVLLGLTSVVAVPFLRARASTGRLVLLVVGGQALTHAALSALAGHAGDRAGSTLAAPAAPGGALLEITDSSGRRTGSLLDQYAAASDAAPAGAASDPLTGLVTGLLDLARHQLAHLTEQGPAMLLTHTLGAVALGLWLAVGERALWHLLHLGAARLASAARAHLVLRGALAAVRDTLSAGRPCPPVVAGWRPPLDQVLGHQVARRGPPRLLPA